MFDLYNEIIVFFAIKNNTLNLEYQYAYENKHILKLCVPWHIKDFFIHRCNCHRIRSIVN